jgi:hypothetical protein
MAAFLLEKTVSFHPIRRNHADKLSYTVPTVIFQARPTHCRPHHGVRPIK